MTNQSIEDTSANVDALAGDVMCHRFRFGLWRYFVSLVIVTAFWGPAWLAPSYSYFGFLFYVAPLSSIGLLGILTGIAISDRQQGSRFYWGRVVIFPALFIVVLGVTFLAIGPLPDVADVLLLLIALLTQFVLTALIAMLILRWNHKGRDVSRRFSLWTLLMMITIGCIAIGLIRLGLLAMDNDLREDFISRLSSYLTFGFMDAIAVLGPILSLLPPRRRYRLLVLAGVNPYAFFLAIAVLALSNWLTPDSRLFYFEEAVFMALGQTVIVSLSLLPMILSPSPITPQIKAIQELETA